IVERGEQKQYLSDVLKFFSGK
ncbi:hypothetical protein OLS72_10240, partial [Campylobacter jejuni]|nr:hypothetical protein [Campylobacter jejuni]